MTERPIPFSAEMVRAILDGRKTQTRRNIKYTTEHRGPINPAYLEAHKDHPGWKDICPYGQPGDLLWVREPFCAHWGAPPYDAPQSYRIVTGDELPPIEQENGDFYQPVPSDIMTIWYEAEGNKPFHMEWKLPDEMPRWASRITLRITDIRVERLQDISEDDARAEGAMWHDGGTYWHSGWRHDYSDVHADAYSSFERLWNHINGPGAWDANPWVWAISFERVKP
jgi:hypothetical protein